MIHEENSKMRIEITAYAKSLGFDIVGFSPAKLEQKYIDVLREWLAMKNEGGMEYMRDIKSVEARCDISKLLPGAKSVIVVAMNYFRLQEPLKRGHGRIARYAFGRDYHKIIGKKLKNLAQFVRVCGAAHMPNADTTTRHFVDAAPVLERAYASQAGVGVAGKNGCIITKDFGSWVLIGEVITTLPLVIEGAGEKNPFSACGACTRCMVACPTGAIIRPGVIDARRCISYLTIENKGRIPARFANIIKKTKRIFGCDICQEVCPHNISRQKNTTHEEFTEPKIAGDSLFARSVCGIKSDSMFHRLFAGSALKRAKKTGIRRNARCLI